MVFGGVWGWAMHMCDVCLNHLYVGNACRSRVSKVLCKQFRSPQDAEKAFPRLLRAASPVQTQVHQEGLQLKSGRTFCIFTFFSETSPEEIMNPTTPQQQMALILMAFRDLARLHDVVVPADYLEYSITAMQHLKECGRSNVLYLLAKSLATPRDDGKGSPSFQLQECQWGCLNI